MISHTLVTSKKSETVRILYDSDSQPRGYITDSGETVLFVKNLQGDVIALVDENGKVAVEYSYDAWGNMTYTRKNGTSYSAAERLVELCPITYRGYNYDFSTGLYYLQSRYYNPEWGRFLNCDDTNILLATQGETHGANLFAYADNNPVNRVDYTGYWGEDVHKGYFDREKTSRDFYTKACYFNGIFVGYVAHNPYRKTFYGTFYWALECGFTPEESRYIAYYCNNVDSEYSPLLKQYQAWHFNTFRNTSIGLDSRTLLGILKLFEASQYFDLALQFKQEGYDKSHIATAVFLGLKALGTALHPLQDYYAHTDDKVYYNGFLWSHVTNLDTDKPLQRWNQLILTKEITLDVLSTFYTEYSIIFTLFKE